MRTRHVASVILMVVILSPLILPVCNGTAFGGNVPQQIAGHITGQTLEAINDFRRENGLPPLQWDNLLADLAQNHAAHMDAMGKLSHDNFQQRYENSGSGVCVENVAWNMNTPQALLKGWKNSAQHRKNLLAPQVTKAGIGRQGYFTTFFACD